MKKYGDLDFLKGFQKDINDKLRDIKNKLKEKEHEAKVKRASNEERRIKEDIEKLNHEEYLKRLKLEENRKLILNKLDIEENYVFEWKKLVPEEIEVLIEEGYEESTQYDPMTKATRKFLVKKIMKHSTTHTFLNGRTKQILEKYLSREDISMPQTKDADIIFKIGDIKHAFETEIGSLLRKHKQRKEKIGDLNKNYGNNWWFIVPNRNIARKYRKYGRCILRADLSDFIEKLVKNGHALKGM